MSFFGFGQSVDVDILLNDADSRRRAEHKTEDGKKDKYFLFYDGETVSGKVSLALKPVDQSWQLWGSCWPRGNAWVGCLGLSPLGLTSWLLLQLMEMP